MKYLILLPLLLLAACAADKQITTAKELLKLTPVSFADLPGWQHENFTDIAAAFEQSCKRINKQPAGKAVGKFAEAGTYWDWQKICQQLVTTQKPSHAFFEKHFQPYAISAGQNRQGLFTGYYEASLRGSLTKHGPYQTPLYKRPNDLVMVQLGDFREDLKGRRIAGRVKGGNLKPYESRADITKGKWPHNDKVLVWVDDPVDAFFVQIQGSGVVELTDGTTMRIGYAGQNGHPYYAVGRELIKRGQLTKETVSLQSIREWLAAHPDQSADLMNTNASYVFFRKLKGKGPLGGEGVPLTPERSLAIDRTLIPYGTPLWLTARHPQKNQPEIRRLMIAQDTGGAIRGPVRGDFFWGYGAQAEMMAGSMKSKGQYWALLPRR